MCLYSFVLVILLPVYPGSKEWRPDGRPDDGLKVFQLEQAQHLLTKGVASQQRALDVLRDDSSQLGSKGGSPHALDDPEQFRLPMEENSAGEAKKRRGIFP